MKLEIFHIEQAEDLIKAQAIRFKVFVDEQKVPQELELEHEEESQHFLVKNEGIEIATGRFREADDKIKIERLAVLKEYRSLGIGKKLLDYMMGYIPQGKRIYLNAQETAVNFYEKCGFEKVGNPFYEAGIKHFKMEFNAKKR